MASGHGGERGRGGSRAGDRGGAGGEDTAAPGGGGGRRAGTPPGLSPQAIASREELHARYAQSLQDKDALRKRVRELGGKADELQLQLFQREAQLLAAEGQLKRQQLEMLVLVRRPGPRDPRAWGRSLLIAWGGPGPS